MGPLENMEKKSTEINLPSVDEIKQIMETTGKIKGGAFKGELEYILAKKGEEGLRAVEKKTEDLGYPMGYKEIKETRWYPIGLKMISFFAFLSAFNWGKKELAEIAESSVKVSYIIRFFMKYFTSPERMFRMAASRMWERHYNVGSLEAIDFKRTKKDGYAVMRLKNFKLHPFHCLYLGYFFVGTFKLAEPKFKEITVEETKCMFRGDNYHEYLIKWTYK